MKKKGVIISLKAVDLRLSVFAFCLLLFVLSGCAVTIKNYVRKNADATYMNRIAVLPFENYTADEYADEKIRSLVIIDLLSRDKDVIEPGEVLNTLRELKIRSVRSLSVSDIQNIGKRLNVEAVMTGAAGVYKVSRGASSSYPEVSLNLVLYEASTGGIIWSVWHTSGGASFWTRHFGTEGITLDEESRQTVTEAIDTFF